MPLSRDRAIRRSSVVRLIELGREHHLQTEHRVGPVHSVLPQAGQRRANHRGVVHAQLRLQDRLQALAYWCDSRAFGLGPSGQPVHTFSHRKTPLPDEAVRRLWLFDDQDGMHLTGHIDAISYPLITGRPAEMSKPWTDASRHRVIRDDRHRAAALFVDRFEA